MEKEINFIYEYYENITNSLSHNIHPKTLITVPIKIDIYSKLYKFCTDDDNNTEKMYEIYKNMLNKYCHNFNDENLSINNVVNFIDNYEILVKYLYFGFNYLDKHFVKHNELDDLKNELPDKILLTNIIDKNFDKIKNEIKLIINQIRISGYNHIQDLIYNTKLNKFLKILESKDKNNNYINQINDTVLISTYYYQSIDLDYQNNSAEFILEKLNEIWNHEKNLHQEICPNFLKKIEKNFKSITIKSKIDLLLNNNFSGIFSLLRNKNFNSLIFLIQNVNLDNDIENQISNKISSFFYESNKINIDNDLNIEKIINVVESYKYYHQILENINIDLFIEDLESNMSELVNSDIKYIEFIINFFDEYLKSNKTDINVIEIIMDFIKFYNDIDYFYCLYQTKLENRLFNNQSNYNVENKFFNKLLDKYPFRKSSKIMTLFQDIDQSKNFNYELKNLCNFSNDNFNLKILTTTYWNINKDGYFKEVILDDSTYNNNLILANELFNLKHSGLRKLYVNQLEGEIEIEFGNSKIKTVPIIASVLFCYNQVDVNTFDELIDKTKIKEDMMKKIIKLLKDKNIILELADNIYSINCNFDSSDIILNFNNVFEKKKEVEDAFKTVRIEAALVKIMKHNENLNLEVLITKTKEKLNNFNPDSEIIKKVLNELIDREYFEEKDGIINYQNL